MKKRIKIILVGITLIIFFTGIAMGISMYFDIEHEQQTNIDYSDYPATLENNYIWENGNNVRESGMGQYYVDDHQFCGIQYGVFRWVKNTSIYWNEGTSYYSEYGHYRFPPYLYRLEYNYDTNKMNIKIL